MNATTHPRPREIADQLVKELDQATQEFEAEGYLLEDANAMAVGYVIGKNNLAPSYGPKLIELSHRAGQTHSLPQTFPTGG